MKDAKVLDLRKRITLLGDDALTKVMPSRQGIVEVFLRGERKLHHHMKAVRGTAENPMKREEVDAKGYDLMAPVLGRDRARKLCDAIWNLDRLKDVRKLRPLLKEKR
jgi:2-methylcitrate dehydratase PrpD